MGIVDITNKEEMQKYVGKCYYEEDEPYEYEKLTDIVEDESKGKKHHSFKALQISLQDDSISIEEDWETTGPTNSSKEISHIDFEKKFEEGVNNLRKKYLLTKGE